MKELINYIENIYPISQKSLQKILKLSKIRPCKSGEYLCEIGEINHKLFFILEGVTRTYMKLPESDTEINKLISTTGNVTTSIKSFRNKMPADIACQCLTDSIILELPLESLEQLRKEEPDFAEFMYRVIEKEYIRLEETVINLLSKNATQRYLELKKNIKDIDQLIPQFQIASHLGITAIQLSRIKKKLIQDTK